MQKLTDEEKRNHNINMHKRLVKLLTDLENRAISEGLCGKLGVTFDVKSGKITTVREVIDAAHNP